MLLNTFHGKQDHTFTKIYKLYHQNNNKKFSSATTVSQWCGAVNCSLYRCRKKNILAFIGITYIMPFKISKRNSNKFKTFLRPQICKEQNKDL
mgnify:CR=1 FL=1